jgi:hypothetical protein
MENHGKICDTGARFNSDRTRRHSLWRIWNYKLPLLIIVGMNPSSADEHENDPTVERCERRAKLRGYGGIMMINMMDIIETDSRKLDQMPSEVRCSKENTAELEGAIARAQAGTADILCGWGKPGQRFGAVAWFATRASRAKVTLFCLKMNKDGSPAHPLYQPYSADFLWFAGVDEIDASKPLPLKNAM